MGRCNQDRTQATYRLSKVHSTGFKLVIRKFLITCFFMLNMTFDIQQDWLQVRIGQSMKNKIFTKGLSKWIP